MADLVQPTALRLVLFLGLVGHKFLWEVLKRRDRRPRPGPTPPRRRIVKLAKGGLLAFVTVQTLALDFLPITGHSTLPSLAGTLLYVAGLATAVIGRLQLGRNWVDLEEYRVLPDQSLVTHGIYRYIRHPIYSGDVLLLLGLELALGSWLVVGVAVPLAVAIRQALAEEALLAATFPGYRAYCARTKRFIPFVV